MAISYNYSTKAITVDSSATVRAVYSDAMNTFSQSAQMDDLIPLQANTPTLFTLINGWTFTGGSIQYLTSAALQDAAGDNIWTNVQTLGSLASGTTLYIDQGGTVWTAGATGHVNILLKVRSAGSDINSKNFTVYARKFQNTYDQFSTTGGAIVANIPLSTGSDPNLTLDSGTITGYADLSAVWGSYRRSAFDGASTTKYTLNGDHTNSVATITVNESIDSSVASSGELQIEQEVIHYTGKGTNTFTGCTRAYSSTTAVSHLANAHLSTNMSDYGILVKTTNSARTLQQIYNWIQYELLQTSDIDSGAGTHLGYITAKLVVMAGSAIFTQAGVWVEGFTPADANKIQYQDNASTNHTPPLSVPVLINTDSGLNGGYAAVYILDGTYNPSTYTTANIVSTLINTTVSSGVASANMIYTSDLPVVVRVRKAGYQPFELGTTITSNGLAVTAQNPVDTIYQ